MFVSWLPPALVPPALLAMMPSRYLNVGVLAFVPLVVGLLWIHRRSIWSQATAWVFAFGDLHVRLRAA